MIPTASIPVIDDRADLQHRFNYLDTRVARWVLQPPTPEEVQSTHKALLDLEMDCDDFDLSERINWLFKAIDRVQDVVQHPDFDPKDVARVLGRLTTPPNDLNFTPGLDAKVTTLIFYYAIWDGRQNYTVRARRIGAEIRRRDRNAQRNAKQKASE